MPNVLNALGLELATREEDVAYLTAKYQEIYGADINLSSDSPDGQMLNIFVQIVEDLKDLVLSVYNSFNPDAAVGVVLDQRVAINGITRQGATYTITPITIVTTQIVNLYGLDQSDEAIYTVSDNAGNLWYLIDSEIGLSAGTHVLNFRAAAPGAQLTTVNTINVQVTVVLGVSSVNNPTTALSLGVNEESDAVLKVRRQKSVSLASQGYLEALLAALENISGVTSAFVYENDTGSTDSDGVPSHSIWVIIAGAPADFDVATTIYRKRNAGCGMFGEETYTLTQVDGSPFTVRWDRVVSAPLFIFFDATSIDGSSLPNISAIRAYLALNFTPGVYEEVNINALATLVQTVDPNTLVTNAGFSDGTSQTINLSGPAASGIYTLSYQGQSTASLPYTANAAAIQAELRLLSGLELCLVTGSAVSGVIAIDLTANQPVLGLIYVSASTLQTSAPAIITFNYDENPQNVLFPPTKKDQFLISAANIVITPMLLAPNSGSVTVSSTVQFQALGGYAPYNYSVSVNSSGGSINSSIGFYEAGLVGGVSDTILVRDALGNEATATVNVV